MTRPSSTRLARRTVLRAWLALPASLALAACGGPDASLPTQAPAATAAPASPTTAAKPAASAATATQPAATGPTAVPSPTPQATLAPAATGPAPSPAATRAAAPVLAPTPACDDGDDAPTLAQTEGPYFKPNSPERASLLAPGLAGTRLVVSGLVLSTACQPVARALLDFWQCDDKGVYDNAGFTLRGHQFTDEAGRYRLETIVPGLYPGRTRHIHVKVQAPNRPVLTTQLYFPGEPRNAGDGIFNQKLLLKVEDAANGKRATFDFVLTLA